MHLSFHIRPPEVRRCPQKQTQTMRSIHLLHGSWSAAGSALLTLLLFALFSLLALFFLFKSTHYYNSHREAIVIEPSVTVKSSPETESVDKLILHEGTKVTITETLAGWDKITLADGTTGWCQEENLERI